MATAVRRYPMLVPLVLATGYVTGAAHPAPTAVPAAIDALATRRHDPGTPATTDEIIARLIAARGGLDRLHAVQSQRMTGRVSFDGGGGGQMVLEQRQPNRIREEITIQGKLVTRAYDGASGWTIDPFGKPPGLRVLTGDELNNIAAEADFDPLVNYRVTGDHVELVGRDTAAGASAFKLRVTLPSGYADYYYIDSATALPSKWQGRRIVNGKPVVFETYFREYQTVDGLKFTRVIDTGAQGETWHQQLVFDRVELNTPEGDERFAPPTASH